jgi:hypothetical protein
MNMKSFFTTIYEVAGVFIIWISLHYVAANLYPSYCAETTVAGFIKSIFVAQAPHCIAMRWVIYHGGIAINSMWISIAIWISSKLLKSVIVSDEKKNN